MLSFPSRILSVRDLSFQRSSDFPKEQFDDGAIAVSHAKTGVEVKNTCNRCSFNCHGKVWTNVAGDIDKFSFHCIRRLLPMVFLKMSMLLSAPRVPAESGGTHDSSVSGVLLPLCQGASCLVA